MLRRSIPAAVRAPHAGQGNPASIGQPTHAVLIYLNVRPGDQIELIGADAVGTLDGATVRFLVSRPVVESNGDHVIGKDFEDLAGAIIAPATASPARTTPSGSLLNSRPNDPVGSRSPTSGCAAG